MLKAYKLNEFETWAGEDLESAIALAMKETGEDRETVLDPDYGEEAPREIKVLIEDSGVLTTVGAILDAMERESSPGLVCESEC